MAQTSFSDFGQYSLTYVLETGVNYKHAKDRLQIGLAACVYQIVQHGNTNWLTKLFASAQMTEYKAGASVTNADGKQIFRYVTQHLFEGRKIVKWDKTSRQFKMEDGWKIAAEGLDRDRLNNMLRFTRFDRAEQVKSEQAFDLDKKILTLIKTAFDPDKGGVTNIDELISKVRQTHKDMLTGAIRKAS